MCHPPHYYDYDPFRVTGEFRHLKFLTGELVVCAPALDPHEGFWQEIGKLHFIVKSNSQEFIYRAIDKRDVKIIGSLNKRHFQMKTGFHFFALSTGR